MKKKDYLIIFILFILIGVAFVFVNLFQAEPSSLGKVYHNNDLLIEVDFSNKSYTIFPQKENEDYPRLITPLTKNEADLAFVVLGSFLIDGRNTEVVIEVNFELKSIRIERDETPKQIGVNRNWYNGEGLPVVSLPNKISISFESDDDDGLDGIV